MSEYRLCECITQDDINQFTFSSLFRNMSIVIWAGVLVLYNWGQVNIAGLIH